MHPALGQIAKATKGAPYEGRLWLVGGAVRDALLGAPESADLDIVLEADALALARFLREAGVSDIEPVVYPRFGTALIMVGGANVELITARRESYDETSRKPSVEPATLEEDAQRRDFTINTLLRNLHTNELQDPLGTGIEDLEAKVLRTPLHPKRTFFDDPLRMLRAVRFRWKLGFQPAPGLYDSIREEAHRLEIISAERIRDEWVKMLSAPTASSAMRDLMDLTLLEHFAPEFREMVGVDQGKWHHLDVWDHTLLVVDKLFSGPFLLRGGRVGIEGMEPSELDNDSEEAASGPFLPRGGRVGIEGPRPAELVSAPEERPSLTLTLILAGLLHDIGKPSTRSIDADGEIRFFSHEAVGAQMSARLLRRLKFSNEDIDPVVALVKNHMRLGSFDHFTPTAARRLLRDMGDQTEALLALVEADAAALKPGVRAIDLTPIRTRLAEVQAETPIEALESPLNGEEIMALTGLPPGPEIGRIKSALLDEVLEGRLSPGDKEAAAGWVRKQVSSD